MSNPTLIKTMTAGGAISHRRILKHGSADHEVVQAAASSDLLAGVAVAPGGVASGERVDVAMDGIAEVEFGGTVTRGQPVTADASGKAVAASPAAGANAEIIGHALVSAVSGDIAPVKLARGRIQG